MLSNNELVEFLFEKLNRYPIQTSLEKYNNTKDKKIRNNLTSLIPDIDYQNRYKKYSVTRQLDWMERTNAYTREVFENVIYEWNIQYDKLQEYIRIRDETAKFNMEHMNRLPEDIIRYIYDFLPYETRYELIECKYPNLSEELMKLPMKKLKLFISNTLYINHYTPLYDNNNIKNIYLRRCLPIGFRLKQTASAKRMAVDIIRNFTSTIQKALPQTIESHSYFQKEAYMILLNILYVTGVYKVKSGLK